jgi:hypothetical protein
MKKMREWVKQANDMGLTEKVYILAGVTPLKSLGMARYMKNSVPGMDVPDELIKRLQGAGKGNYAKEGIKIACEQIQEFKEMKGVAGVHLMAIEWEHKVPEIAEMAGVLDNGETLLVPNLNSYQENRIEIHPADLPVSFELENRKYDIKIAQSGGAGADFRGYRYRAVEGNLYLLSTDGKKEYLSTLPLETEVNGEKRRAFSGREGYFYLENLPPGEYVLKVLRADGDCKARFIVPESDKTVSSIGEVICEADE